MLRKKRNASMKRTLYSKKTKREIKLGRRSTTSTKKYSKDPFGSNGKFKRKHIRNTSGVYYKTKQRGRETGKKSYGRVKRRYKHLKIKRGGRENLKLINLKGSKEKRDRKKNLKKKK